MSTVAAPAGAMTGLRVIDLTRVLGGPYCTQILADHGADVIKVEPPAGDEVREWGPPFHEEDAAYFVGINRNKRSIGLDLASEGGRAVLLKMLETADVLIENFKPGTLDKWGIGNDHPGHDRHDRRDRIARERPDADRRAAGRHHHRALCGNRHSDGAVGTAAVRVGTVSGDHTL